jgi:hypothetical protein
MNFLFPLTLSPLSLYFIQFQYDFALVLCVFYFFIFFILLFNTVQQKFHVEKLRGGMKWKFLFLSYFSHFLFRLLFSRLNLLSRLNVWVRFLIKIHNFPNSAMCMCWCGENVVYPFCVPHTHSLTHTHEEIFLFFFFHSSFNKLIFSYYFVLFFYSCHTHLINFYFTSHILLQFKCKI